MKRIGLLKNQRNTTVFLGEVNGINKDAKFLYASNPDHKDAALPYDILVIATGVTHSYFGHDKYAGFAPGLKGLADAVRIRNKVLKAFEQAEAEGDPNRRKDLLTFVLVGAGPKHLQYDEAALTGLVRGAAIDLAPRAITANNVQPGPTATDMSAAHADMVKTLIPLKRIGDVSEIAGLVFLRPTAFTVSLPKLGFIFCGDDGNWNVLLFGITNHLFDVAFGDRRFVFVVNQEPWLKLRTTRVSISEDVIAIFRKLFADRDARPAACFRSEVDFLPLSDASNLRHLGFQLMIPLTKSGDFPQGVFHPTIDVVDFVGLLLLDNFGSGF